MTDAELLGSIGVALLLLAFFLNLFGYLRAGSYAYMVLNLIGAGMSCVSSWLIDFIPFVVLEGTWAAVAGIALARRLAMGPRQPDTVN